MYLLVVFVRLLDPPVRAQSIQQTPGTTWQTELTRRYTALRQRTHQLAQQHGWPLYKNYSNHRQIRLQEVDDFGEPVYYTLHNAEAAQGTRTQALWGNGTLPVALSGNSPTMAGRLGLWDGGRVLAAHREFMASAVNSSRVTQRDGATSLNDHATHLAGTLVAAGVDPKAKGMAYDARLAVWDYTDDLPELTAAASTLLISNHAYGPVVGWVLNPSRPGTDPTLKWEWWGNPAISPTDEYLFGFYTTKARDLDRVAYNNPFYLMVRSADNKRSETGPPAGSAYFLKNTNAKSTAVRSRNDAYDVIPAEATAKNVLTVGAADPTPGAQPSFSATAYSGWGPTDDGRIKPDLVGIGSAIFSTVATNNTAYGNYMGTSMASANVAGSLFLLQELYARLGAAGKPSGSGSFMRAATLRGLALHTAERNQPANGPDYRQGWGLLNTEAAARVILNEEQNYLLLEQTLTPGGLFSRQIVAQGNEPLIVTICWTDPEGPATAVVPGSLNNRTPKLVNDLDLRVSDGQIEQFPFVLNPTQPGRAATRGDNRLDNVEQVYVASPTPGQSYTIRISHKGAMTHTSQPFSVVVSGLRRTRCASVATLTPGGEQWLCNPGQAIRLQANATAGASVEWLRDGAIIANARTTAITVTEPGRYQVRVTQGNCQALSAETVIWPTLVDSIDLLPRERELTLPQGAAVTLLAPVESTFRYQWFRDGNALTNAVTSRLLVSQEGVYKVQISQQNCVGFSPERVVKTGLVTGTTATPDNYLMLYPNPAERVLSVRYANPAVKQVRVSMFDLRGVLQRQPTVLKPFNGRFEGELPIGELPAGQYVLRLTDGLRTETRRFVKK